MRSRELDTASLVNVQPPAQRIVSLDSIRGIAAVLVVFAHLYSTLPEMIQQSLLWHVSPFRLLVVGRPAVIVFFVLSGVVLSLSLQRYPELSYKTFVVRRFFRIYVPFAVSIFASAALYSLIDPRPLPSLSAWFNRDIWSEELSFSLLASHLAMVGRPQDAILNGPMWSLIIELRLSLIFPFLFFLLWPRAALLAAALLASALLTNLIAGNTSLGSEPYFNHSFKEVILISLYFLPFFLLGILIARHRDRVQLLVSQVGFLGQGLLFISALALLSIPDDLANGVGAGLVIILAFGVPAVATLLSTPVLGWLGRISYSLYLVHVPVLGALVHLLYGSVSLEWIFLGVMVVSLAAAHLSYRFVELPSMLLGKRLTAAN